MSLSEDQQLTVIREASRTAIEVLTAGGALDGPNIITVATALLVTAFRGMGALDIGAAFDAVRDAAVAGFGPDAATERKTNDDAP